MKLTRIYWSLSVVKNFLYDIVLYNFCIIIISQIQIHPISPDCPRSSIVLQVQNRGLKHQSFIYCLFVSLLISSHASFPLRTLLSLPNLLAKSIPHCLSVLPSMTYACLYIMFYIACKSCSSIYLFISPSYSLLFLHAHPPLYVCECVSLCEGMCVCEWVCVCVCVCVFFKMFFGEFC